MQAQAPCIQGLLPGREAETPHGSPADDGPQNAERRQRQQGLWIPEAGDDDEHDNGRGGRRQDRAERCTHERDCGRRRRRCGDPRDDPSERDDIGDRQLEARVRFTLFVRVPQ